VTDTHLPTREDIVVYGMLDELTACEHFLGKSLDDAEQLFRDNSAFYQEDLMWMGPVAFRFYVEAAIRYLRSPAAKGDDAMVSCLAAIIQFRLEYEPREVVPVAPQLHSICDYIDRNWDKFDVNPEIYVGRRERYKALQQTLARIGREVRPE
jgi:hypothetical protein